MKKITLVMILFVCSIITHAQDVLHVQEIYTSTWNHKTEKWDQEKTSPLRPFDMRIMLHGNMVTINDQAKSNYRTGEVFKEIDNDDESTTCWRATDEKNRYCRIRLTWFKKTGNRYFVVIYDEFMLEYFYAD